jgi:putative tryptophan/tyrosine transport system substrate-binding protein
MKKLLTLAVLLCLIAGALFSEGQGESEMISIGISKIVAHPALDAVEQGIQDELAALGFTDIKYDLQNANGDLNTAASIANKFKAEKVDIAIGIATPTAQALATNIKNVPVIYTAVTDPVDAGLVASYDKGEANITGVSDMTPVEVQLEMLFKLVKVEKLGHIYSSGEANAVQLASIARDVCAKNGIEFVETTVTNSAEVKQAAQSIINKVDAIYVSTDNTVVSALSSITDVAMRAGVPIMSADPSSAEQFDILVAYGFDYYGMGRVTGKLAADILKGKDPVDIPTQYMTNADDLILHLNLDVAEAIGITLSSSIIDQASVIVKDGMLEKK